MPVLKFSDVSPVTRRVMQANKGKNTQPEMVVRKLLHGMGYRYRLHRKSLPGKPDLVFGTRKAIVEVRGCFWHGHNCKLGHVPKSREDYWLPKIAANKARDSRNVQDLLHKGWRVMELWECDIRRGPAAYLSSLRDFLDHGIATAERTRRRRSKVDGGLPAYASIEKFTAWPVTASRT